VPKVVGSVFEGFRQEGDFAWMIKQPQYADTLFIFNDNVEQFQKFLVGTEARKRGLGNAVIRPYRHHDPPRAAGIPTGSLLRGGFISLTVDAKYLIDRAFEVIGELVETGRYSQMIYSDDGFGGLGTGIFMVGKDVKDYIVRGLKDFDVV
jgi:hypothetical protein